MIPQRRLEGIKRRRAIYNLIDSNPGLHLRDISRKTNIPKTTVKYHLNQLRKQELIEIKVEDKFKRYYITLKTGTLDKKLIGLIRRESLFKMFLYFLHSVSCSQIELSKALEIHPSIVSYNLKKMKDMDLIEEAPLINGNITVIGKSKVMVRKPIGRERFYVRKNNENFKQAFNLIVSNKKSFCKEKFYEGFFEGVKGGGIPKKYPGLQAEILNVVSAFEEFMRPPFCA